MLRIDGRGHGQRQEDQVERVAGNQERDNSDLENDTSGGIIRNERF